MRDPASPPSSTSRSPIGPAEILVICACVAILAGFMQVNGSVEYRSPPDFASLQVDEKKRQFFTYLRPMISAINLRFAADHDRLRGLRVSVDQGERLSWGSRRWLHRLATRFDVGIDSMALEAAVEMLEHRAGIVPESIVLVQAAVESGWGTSRFALEANNYFGQRCYTANCGVAPRVPVDGARFGLARFSSASASVESYMLNLNTHEGYREFRELRDERRNTGEPITGLSLVSGLINYSERGPDYVAQIALMIRTNNLE